MAARLRLRSRKKQQRSSLEHLIEQDPPYLQKQYIGKEIGYGVFTTNEICKDEIVCIYHGDMIEENIAEEREQGEFEGNFVYFIEANGKRFCIDATSSSRIGKYINDSPLKYANCRMKLEYFDHVPYLVLYAARYIPQNEELRYDYSAKDLWWRKNKGCLKPTNMNLLYKYLEEDNSGIMQDHVISQDETEIINDTGYFINMDSQEKNLSMDEVETKNLIQRLSLQLTERVASSDEDNVEDNVEAEILPGSFQKVLSEDDSNVVQDVIKNLVNHVLENLSAIDFDVQDSAELQCYVIPNPTSTPKIKTVTPKEPVEEEQEEVRIFNDSGFFLDPDLTILPSEDSEISEVDEPEEETVGERKKLEVKEETRLPKKTKKPHRPCPYCGKFQSALSRHIKTKHRDEETVKMAFNLPKKERHKRFDDLKKQGIRKHNEIALKCDKPDLMRERKSRVLSDVTNLIMCSTCNGFFARPYYHRHKKICTDSTPPVAIKLHALVPPLPCSEEYSKSILSKLRDDDVGNLIRKDEGLMIYGKQAFNRIKSRTEKSVEVKQQVRSNLRRLGLLYLKFKEQEGVRSFYGHAGDMLRRENFSALCEALEQITMKEDKSMKDSLRVAIQYLLKNMGKAIKTTFLIANRDNDAKRIDDFVLILDMHKDLLFGHSAQSICKNTQRNLRKPLKLPLEEDLVKIRNHILVEMKNIVEDVLLFWDSAVYVKLRDLACTRLTLFNARRGGEPGRMLLTEWKEAENKEWIDDQRAEKIDDPISKNLLQSLLITYQNGKGNYKLVPILIPEDCAKALKLLVDPERRRHAGIHRNNKYVLPCTQASENHVSGWHAVNNICKELDLRSRETITATKNRHRISTLFAALDLPRQERELFFDHMGHEENMNKHIYQAPPAIAEVVNIGRHLKNIDEGCLGEGQGSETRYPKSALVVTKKIESGSDEIQQGTSETKHASERKKFELRKRQKTKEKTLESQYSEEDIDDTDEDKDFVAEDRSESDEDVSDDEVATMQPVTKRGRGRPRKSENVDEVGRGRPRESENSSECTLERKNYRWTDIQNKALYEFFGAYIYRKSNRAMPNMQMIEAFIKQHKLNLDPKAVRVKVVNERTKADLLAHRRKRQLNM